MRKFCDIRPLSSVRGPSFRHAASDVCGSVQEGSRAFHLNQALQLAPGNGVFIEIAVIIIIHIPSEPIPDQGDQKAQQRWDEENNQELRSYGVKQSIGDACSANEPYPRRREQARQ